MSSRKLVLVGTVVPIERHFQNIKVLGRLKLILQGMGLEAPVALACLM